METESVNYTSSYKHIDFSSNMVYIKRKSIVIQLHVMAAKKIKEYHVCSDRHH